ncbi:MAG: DNA translocase FtsK [Candidatus Pacebacteria bacterium]|jgi:S-DNA-T family DNA segregation ATPase FtsK/SpoIIIE|nr:DNA translocase FtsK [Candidatus Paceibacterota bacterium]MDD2757362.1 DNA translocase FtsK [Candidatus Paceibacterota bacterium]MDD3283732.1 DNA translocase FtsK [Candidatus Paceibacterota bacterium]MDD3969878.1 DNA translocase FtsK [Candidatus Paceibacterota bacterium]MDD4737976.1 DNA translocase FtsK [Candidatus Paceibacterota bacterium]
MAKKKKDKKIISPKKFNFSLPEKTKRYLFASLSFLLAIIFVFSFSDNAGTVGEVLKNMFGFLIGNVIYIIPIIFAIFGIILLKGGEHFEENRNSLIISTITLIIGLSGFFSLLNPELVEKFVWNKSLDGGWIGYLISWPILRGLDYIVSYALFSIAILISLWIIIQPFKKTIEEVEEEEEEEEIEEVKVEVSKKKMPSFDLSKFIPKKEEKVEEVKKEDKSLKTFEQKKQENKEYKYPPLDLLSKKGGSPEGGDISYNSSVIKRTLHTFGIPVEMSEVNVGPTVTQYTLKPAEGIKLSKITALQNDLALALASPTIRIEAPIPGRSLVGIEIGNKKRAVVSLRETLDTDEFKNSPAPLLMALGKDVKGTPTFADLAEMPHLLVGGTTGSGKTICLNSIILSLLYRNSPDEMKLILVDPKRVEFPIYSNLEHLLCPVIYDANQTLVALKWLVGEMERRFTVLAEAHSRDITSYNQKMEKKGEDKLPYIILIIDELADLMSVKGKEIESYVVRLAQMSRATGIHLILATQRPSVEVITGLIKANITSRVALKVGSLIDSRTILDGSGAEKLLGKGDLLLLSKEFSKPKRVQNPFISENEIKKVINWITDSNLVIKEDAPESLLEIETEEDNSLMSELTKSAEAPETQMDSFYSKEDPMYEEAKRTVISSKKASTSLLQRRLGIGYARAARLMDILEERGIVGPQEGAKPREVYFSEEE